MKMLIIPEVDNLVRKTVALTKLAMLSKSSTADLKCKVNRLWRLSEKRR